MKLALVFILWAVPAFGSPISGPSGFLTLPEAKAMAQAGALTWTSSTELQAAFFFDPMAGRAPTTLERRHVLTVGDDNRASVARDAFDAMTCGRVQIDLEQYGAHGLDYASLLVLFVDSGIDCGDVPRITPFSVEPMPSVPEVSTVLMFVTGLAGLILRRRTRV